jgi:hypothetical protein
MEGVHMRNCLATYSANVVWGACCLYSIRRGGVRVAAMEIRPVRGTRVPEIAHLLGPGNASVGEEVWQAALTWLRLQSNGASEGGSFLCATPTDEAFQKYVWQPYSAALHGGRLSPPPLPALLHAAGVLRSLEKS